MTKFIVFIREIR